MNQMNISKPIKISYIWDRENFKKAFDNLYTYQYKNSIRRYIGWLFIAMSQFGVVFALKGGSVALLMLSTILIFYWYVAKRYLVEKREFKKFENSPLKDKEIYLEIGDNWIKQQDSLIAWQNIQGLIPIEDDILLYHKDRAYYIPAKAFNSIEDKSRLKSIAKKRGKYFEF